MAPTDREIGEPFVVAAGDEQTGLGAQKKSVKASERDEAARAVWRESLTLVAAERLGFVDECGSHTSLTPLYAYAPRKERAVGSVPENRGPNTTLLGALSVEGIQAAMTVEGAVEGAADGVVFEAFVEQVLCPTLQAGQIVVMDNLSTHKSARIRELIEERHCLLWFLPTYSPDLNPIEMAWSKLKAYLRVVGVRTREALEEAIGQGLQTITAQDARNWLKHCYQLIW